jgi:serine/threonine-protein kinase
MAAAPSSPNLAATIRSRPPSGPQAAVAPQPESETAPPPAPAPGENDPYIDTVVADRYKVIRKLGEGGMGVVYLAEHVFIEKKVALKILSEDFARKADLVARFMQEAKAASKIGHENIIDITDFGETASGSVFFAMEFLDGNDLAHEVREHGPMPFERAHYIMNQLCRALGAAHTKGIIHRDLKPENIYLIEREGKPDFVKVLDFGIAKISSFDEGGSRLTRTGMIFGTPEYMSPEQAKGDRPDHRVDIYAAGCILYEMLTGDVPFHAETFMGVLTKHMFEAPEPPSQRAPDAGVTPELEAVVMKALAKDRDQRFQTMKEFALALEAVAGGDPSLAWGSEGSGVVPPSPSSRPAKGEGSQVTRSPRHAGKALVPSAPAIQSDALADTLKPRGGRRRGRAALVVGLGALVGLGGVAVVIATRPKPPPPIVDTRPVEPPKPTIDPKGVVAPKPVEPPKPTSFQITIMSQPSEAEVFRGPELLGRTPASLDLKASTSEVDLTIRKKGYKDQKLHVVPDRNREYVVPMQPVGHHGPPPKPQVTVKPESTPKPETKPETKPEAKPAGKLRDLKDPFAN